MTEVGSTLIQVEGETLLLVLFRKSGFNFAPMHTLFSYNLGL